MSWLRHSKDAQYVFELLMCIQFVSCFQGWKENFPKLIKNDCAVDTDFKTSNRDSADSIQTRNATQCSNRDDLLHLCFTLKTLIFSNAYT